MSDQRHPLAPEHLPHYFAAADGSDFLFNLMIGFIVLIILGIGVAYFTLHSVPEHMAKKGNHTQLQLVTILGLLGLFTHNGLFWIAALILAAFRAPDVVGPLRSIAESLHHIARPQPMQPDAASKDD
ncbi:MAG: hypothetical protein AAF965_06275 [Pseudomonadota bacterium]